MRTLSVECTLQLRKMADAMSRLFATILRAAKLDNNVHHYEMFTAFELNTDKTTINVFSRQQSSDQLAVQDVTVESKFIVQCLHTIWAGHFVGYSDRPSYVLYTLKKVLYPENSEKSTLKKVL